MKEDILIICSYDYSEKHLICLVNDLGVGIKEEDHPKIFNLYKSKNNFAFDQIGMGLFISKQLVQTYDGSLDFISESTGPHRGTTFILTFKIDVNESSIEEGEKAQEIVNLDEINMDI